MQALVLEKKGRLALRDIEIPEQMGPGDVKIAVHTVGICGSDVHYYEFGRIGPYEIERPMVLGHEASGTILEVGKDVTRLKPGDRVCMEPGIPDPTGRATRLGLYNLDRSVRFWATPPVHGCLRPIVVHPADFTYKLPENVTQAEGALVEPLAVGMHAAGKARIRPGDLAVVSGAGTIGMVTALAALAGGCSHVVISDIVQPKLDLAATFGPVTPVNVKKANLKDVVMELTDGWGADIVFECSGNPDAASRVFEPLCPGGRVVLVGLPVDPISFRVGAAMSKEATIETVFRYAHVYPRAIALMAGGKIDVKPLITDTFPFSKSVEAFEYALHMPPTSVKVQIVVADDSRLAHG